MLHLFFTYFTYHLINREAKTFWGLPTMGTDLFATTQQIVGLEGERFH